MNSVTLKSGVATASGQEITYKPNAIASDADTVYYAVTAAGKYMYSNVKIIPATSVYYEDSFVSYSGNWTAVYDNGKTDAAISAIKQIAGVGVYGYDSAYGEYTNYSLGKAMSVTVAKGGATATAQFTFTGTGFELYSATTATQGGFKVSVYDANGNMVGMKQMVSTRSADSYWQIPVFENTALAYGTYTVKIEVAYSTALDLTAADGTRLGSVSFILDGIRVYNNKLNEAYGDIYAADGEYNAQYIDVRDALLSANSFNSANGSVSGAVYIDGRPAKNADGSYKVDSKGNLVVDHKITTSNVAEDYKNYGPKNEVYLATGQGIAFKLSNMSNVVGVHIGLKSADGKAVSVAVNGKTIGVNSSTEMYYAATASDGKIVIVNNGTGIVSVTSVKVTYAKGATQSASLIADTELCGYAAAQLSSIPAGEGYTYVEPTEPEDVLKSAPAGSIRIAATEKAIDASITIGKLVEGTIGGGK